MTNEDVQAGIPHRGSMLLIDSILERNDDSIVCEKTFRSDEFFFDGHFPDNPIVPGVIQCECCLQTGALLLGGLGRSEDSDDPAAADVRPPMLPVATRMDSVKFKQMVRPGDTVRIEVQMKEVVSNAYYMTGKMTLAGKLTTRLDFTCSLVTNQ